MKRTMSLAIALAVVVSIVVASGSPALAFPTIPVAAFCVDDTVFEFDLEVSDTGPTEMIVRIGGDTPVFAGNEQRIAVNFDSITGDISRGVVPEVQSFSPSLDRWVDGLITDYSITNIGPDHWRFAGSVVHGADRFRPGDVVFEVALRTFVGGVSRTTFLRDIPIGDCNADTSPPTWSAGSLTAGELMPNSVRLSWSGASDNFGVVAYEIEQDGVVVTMVDGATTSAVIGGLDPATSHLFRVEAIDAAGNRSTDGPSVVVVTPPPPDASPPTWPGGALTASDITDRSVRLSWSGAVDDTGVDVYEVEQDGTVVATVNAATSSVVISGLAAVTTFSFTVEALDAVGNRSTDGPIVVVRTLDAAPSGHVGPPLGVPDVAWADNVPFGAIDQARTDEIAVVVASTGAETPVTVPLALLVPVSLDVDRDGTDDISVVAELRPPRGPGTIPALAVTTTRLGAPGPADIEVLAFLPIDALTRNPATLVTGFRTLAPDGGTGGFLPVTETITFEVDVPGGSEHNLLLDYATISAPNPLRFLGGVIEGAAATGATAVGVLTMTVDKVPSVVETRTHIGVSAVGAAPGLDAEMSWTSPPAELRPNVSFGYGETEQRPRTPETSTELVFEPIAPYQSVALEQSPTGPLATLTISGDQPNDAISVVHTRADGFQIVGRFDDVVSDISFRVDGSDEISIRTGSTDTALQVEIIDPRPGADLFQGVLSHPITYLLASVSDTYDVDVVPDFSSGRIAFDVSTTFGYDLAVVAADDVNDLRLPPDQDWPAVAPRDWRNAPGGGRADPQLQIGVVDEAAGSTVAFWGSDVGDVTVNLNAATLAQTFTFAPDGIADLDVAGFLEAGSPIAGPESVNLSCAARLFPQATGVEVTPSGRVGVTGRGFIRDLVCDGERAGRSAHVEASYLPSRTAIDLDPGSGGQGSLGIVAERYDNATDSFEPDEIRGLVVAFEDPRGLIGPELLGSPATNVIITGTGIPNSDAVWVTDGEQTAFIARSLVAEDPIDELGVVVATGPPPGSENDYPRPTEFNPNAPSPGTFPFSRFRLWETRTFTLLGGDVANSLRTEAQYVKAGDRFFAEIDAVDEGTDFVASVVIPGPGHFGGGRALNGACVIEFPEAISQATIMLPELLALSAGSLAGIAESRCRISVVDPVISLDVDVLLLGQGLPVVTTLRTDPVESVSVDGAGGTIQNIGVEVRANSPDGLPVNMLGRTINAIGARFDVVDGATVSWAADVSGAGITITGSPQIGAVQAELTTASTARLEAPDPGHLVAIEDRSPDGDLTIAARFHDLGEADLLFSADPAVRSRVALETGAPDVLDFSAILGAGSVLGQAAGTQLIALDGTIDNLPDSLTYETDWQLSHSIAASGPGVDLALSGIVDDDPTDDDANLPIGLDAVIEGIPSTLDLSGANISLTGSGAIVTAGGTLDLIDVVLTDGRPDGIGSNGANRIRVRAEEVPLSLFVEVDDSGLTTTENEDGEAALSGLLRIAGSSGAPLGSLLIQSDDVARPGHDVDHFGTPFGRIEIALDDVPRNWDVTIERDDVSGEVVAMASVDDGLDPGVVTAGDAVGRIDVLIEREPERGTTADPGAFLRAFEDADRSTIARSVYAASIDDGYWSGATATRIARLYGRGVPLPLGTATTTSAPDGLGAGDRTIPLSDHVITGGYDKDDIDLVSVQLSDIHAVTAHLTDQTASVTLERPPGTAATSLFVGYRRLADPRYDDLDLPFKATCEKKNGETKNKCLGSQKATKGNKKTPAQPGGEYPVVEGDDLRFVMGMGNSFRIDLGYSSPSSGFETAAEQKQSVCSDDGSGSVFDMDVVVVGRQSGGRAEVTEFTGGDTLVVENWSGIDFSDGEMLDLHEEVVVSVEEIRIAGEGLSARLSVGGESAGDFSEGDACDVDGDALTLDRLTSYQAEFSFLGESFIVAAGSDVTRDRFLGETASADLSTTYETYFVIDAKKLASGLPEIRSITLLDGPIAGSVQPGGNLTWRYTPPDDFAGRDAFHWQVCSVDGVCADTITRIRVVEPYDQIIAAEATGLPDTMTLTVIGADSKKKKTEAGEPAWALAGVAWDTPGGLGTIDAYVGAYEPPPFSEVKEVRIVGTIDADSGLLDLSALDTGFPGTLGLDSSGHVEVTAVIQKGDRRWVIGADGEDLEISYGLDGIIVDLIPGLTELSSEVALPCDPVLGIDTCIQLIGIGVVANGSGDDTGEVVDGFYAAYRRLETHPAAPASAEQFEFVPRHTLQFQGLRSVTGTAQLQLDVVPPLLQLDIDLAVVASSLHADFWDNGIDVCFKFPFVGKICTPPFDQPDYLTLTPWHLL